MDYREIIPRTTTDQPCITLMPLLSEHQTQKNGEQEQHPSKVCANCSQPRSSPLASSSAVCHSSVSVRTCHQMAASTLQSTYWWVCALRFSQAHCSASSVMSSRSRLPKLDASFTTRELAREILRCRHVHSASRR